MQYVVQVRALAELGTDDAGRILERQLQRRLTDDQIEQSWYWIDLANGLRSLNRAQSLPHLLRCAESAGDLPLGHFFAAETICFLGFAGYLRQTDTPLGRAALRVLHRALEGLRFGVQPTLVAEARVGEMIETLWDNRAEAGRSAGGARLRRGAAGAAAGAARRDGPGRRGVGAGGVRLADVAPGGPGAGAGGIPGGAPAPRCARRLQRAPAPEQRDLLLALIDLRAEAAPAVLPLLAQPRFPHAELALESSALVVRPARRAGAARVGPGARAAAAPRPAPPFRPAAAAAVGRRGLPLSRRCCGRCAACRRQQTEDFLLLAARDWDPTYRAAAVSSLGWWEPLQRPAGVADACRTPGAIPTRTCARPPAPPWPASANARRCSGSGRR